MLISAVAALALFAAPETTQSGDTAAQAPAAEAAAAAEAKPEMRKICTTVEVAGSNLPKKKCRLEPVKAAPKEEAEKAAPSSPGA